MKELLLIINNYYSLSFKYSASLVANALANFAEAGYSEAT